VSVHCLKPNYVSVLLKFWFNISIFCRDDSVNVTQVPEKSKQPRLPLTTLDDIGKAPSLMNDDPRRGRRVRLKVLTFLFSPERQDKWADLHKFALHSDSFNRNIETVMEIRQRIPQTWRLGLVPYNGKHNIGCTAIIVASNATLEELELAQDLMQIQVVQKILGMEEPPYWVRPVCSWYVSIIYYQSPS
jgi:hypothetical protein